MLGGKMHRNPSVMGHTFSKVPTAEIQRSVFDRSCGHKFSCDAGYIYPVLVDEIVPGDSAQIDPTIFARLATPIFPLMDNMYADIHWFFVPDRLLWDNFERFMGAQDSPGDSVDFLEPVAVSPAGTGHAVGSIFDYMGIPPAIPDLTYRVAPFRAYNLIWNSWYKDQNMQNAVTVLKTNGPDPVANYALLRRGKRPDYFTSALPFLQKGPAATIPLGTAAPVRTSVADQAPTAVAGLRFNSTAGVTAANAILGLYAGTGTAGTSTTAPSAQNQTIHPTNLYADLSTATSATINSLRQAFAVQKLFERDARGGTRYVESILSHFRVQNPDFRLQRPEYLGGGSTPISVSAIPQTSATASQPTPMGALAAMGTFLNVGNGFRHAFTEHGWLLGLLSIRADLTYQQGIERMWNHRTRIERYWPALSHIGEQAIARKEIFATGVPANDDAIFGYQERYAELRYKPSRISGLLRSTAAGTLDSWHLAQEFSAAPTLSASFIEENPPLDRVVAVPSEPKFIVDCYFKYRHARPLPTYGQPGFIDRF